MWCIHKTQYYAIQRKKLLIHDADEPQKYYGKSKKPDTKHYICLDSIYRKYPKEARDSRSMAAWA